MDTDKELFTVNTPWLPPHTRQATKALGILLFFSLLMFSLPFGAFFGIRHLLQDVLDIEGYSSTVWSVIAAVITVNMIILGYAYIAYHEPEYDDDGNLVQTGTKSDLNKQD